MCFYINFNVKVDLSSPSLGSFEWTNSGHLRKHILDLGRTQETVVEITRKENGNETIAGTGQSQRRLAKQLREMVSRPWREALPAQG